MSMYLCPAHGGHGFVADCQQCANPSADTAARGSVVPEYWLVTRDDGAQWQEKSVVQALNLHRAPHVFTVAPVGCVTLPPELRAKALQSGPVAQEGMVERKDIVPGVMHCAKCGFQLIRVSLNVASDTVAAGNNKTEACPNGCGPLWPMTWEQRALYLEEVSAGYLERLAASEARVGQLELEKKYLPVPQGPFIAEYVLLDATDEVVTVDTGDWGDADGWRYDHDAADPKRAPHRIVMLLPAALSQPGKGE